jgi:hypothetical protein
MTTMAVEEDQKIHFNGIDDDPVTMWLKLEAVHHSKRPGTRFNAYNDFFSIRKKDDESLQAFLGRIDEGMRDYTR